MANKEEPASKDVLTDPLVLQIDQIIRQRQEELFHRLSHALESLRAGGAVRSGTMETVDSLSAVNLPIKSDDWHNVLQTGGRLEDCGVKLQTLQEEADKIPGAEAARVSVDPRSRKRKAQGAKKKRWQVNAIPLLEEEEYEALADERSRRRAQRTASGDETEEKPVPAKQTWTSLLANWVNSKNFEGIFAAVIFSNSIFLGVSLEYESGIIGLDLPPIFKVFDLTYAALFTLELLLKIWVDGRNFFCTQDRGMIFWNYLDLTIVCTSMVEVIFDILLVVQAGGDGDSARIAPTNLIRVVRIVRVLRVMRVIKVVKFIAGLTSLISSILSTLKSLLWSLLLLLMVMYVFGILFTDTVIGYISLHNLDMVAEGSMEADLLTHFGSLHLSMHTLFRAVTGGVDWGDMANLLIYINWIWGYFFTGYIAFSYFAVLNVMTAVFCKRAIESAEQDEQNIMQRFHEDQKRSRKCIEQLFHIFDGLEADGAITLCELENFFEQEEVRAMFQSLDLSARDSWTLFKLLDEAGNGDINLAEFMEGCLRLRGPAKALDIACVMDESRRIKRKVFLADERLQQLESQMGVLLSKGLPVVQGNDAGPKYHEGVKREKAQMQLPDQEFDLPYDVGPDLDFDVHPQIMLPGTLLT